MGVDSLGAHTFGGKLNISEIPGAVKLGAVWQ